MLASGDSKLMFFIFPVLEEGAYQLKEKTLVVFLPFKKIIMVKIAKIIFLELPLSAKIINQIVCPHH